MITEFLLLIFHSIVEFAVSLLPNANSFPPEVAEAVASFSVQFQKINSFLPLDVFFSIISLVLTIESGILLFKLLNWTLNKLRGSG